MVSFPKHSGLPVWFFFNDTLAAEDPKQLNPGDHGWTMDGGQWIGEAIQGGHCVLETAVRKPLCYDTMIQNIILPQIGSAQKSN